MRGTNPFALLYASDDDDDGATTTTTTMYHRPVIPVRKKRSQGLPSAPAPKVGGRRVGRRGVPASKRRAPPKEEKLGPGWTLVGHPSPAAPLDAKATAKQIVTAQPPPVRQRHHAHSNQAAARRPIKHNRTARRLGRLRQPGHSSCTQRAPAPPPSQQRQRRS
jgi:hypothetical protein